MCRGRNRPAWKAESDKKFFKAGMENSACNSNCILCFKTQIFFENIKPTGVEQLLQDYDKCFKLKSACTKHIQPTKFASCEWHQNKRNFFCEQYYPKNHSKLESKRIVNNWWGENYKKGTWKNPNKNYKCFTSKNIKFKEKKYENIREKRMSDT